jgi:SAM-dependent methyltransferase
MKKQWYEELFTNYAKTYDREIYTQGTIQEVAFIESEINHDKKVQILDIGGGTGRHDIELAKRGYRVVGVDLSESQIRRAQEKARTSNVQIDFQIQDARKLTFSQQFELVIMLCEGAFPLMETDEMNFEILQNAARALKQKGKFIFTTLSALFPLFHSVKDFINQNAVEGKSADNNFDLMTFRDYSTFEALDDLKQVKVVSCNERYYAPSEITWMLKSLGFSKIDISGCDTGSFVRGRQLSTNDYEMLVVAEK